MRCLDENGVAAFVDGQLSREARAEVDAHVDGCEACRELLARMAPFLEPARGPAPEPTHVEGPSDATGVDAWRWQATMRVGTVIAGKFMLDALLGVGGTAAVYAATHVNNRSRAAIKVIHHALSGDAAARRRLLREGYAANAIGHPGIARVLDDGVTEDGALFLVLELLEGETLAHRAHREGKLDRAAVLRYADDVLDMLAAAHAKGIVHRDVKPDNIVVTARGETKLLDFGIAHVREGADPALRTRTGVVLGTPAFMPPEQALGKKDAIGPATDTWAVGATMFLLLTGRAVHEARSMNEALAMATRDPAPALRSVDSSIPASIAAIVDRALAFDVGKRWESARAMQRAVRAARRPSRAIYVVLGAVAVLGALAAAALFSMRVPQTQPAVPTASSARPGPSAAKAHRGGKALGDKCVTGECGSYSSCIDGKCACPDGHTPCGGVCFDLNTDPNACGRCGHACGKNESCSLGACTASSDPK